jgi:hypothetical protein
VIKVGTLAKIRRLYLGDKLFIIEISRQTGMSRNTVSGWLSEPEMIEPKLAWLTLIGVASHQSEWLRIHINSNGSPR